MKKYALTLIALAISSILLAQEGIHFSKGSWNDILAKAKNENKNIFIDCYTSWCGPCKMLSKNIFPLKEVGDYFNPNFVSIKVDMEKEGDGLMLQKKFDVSVFPSMIICNSNGEELHRFTGYMSGEQIVQEAKKIEGGKTYSYYCKEYDAGNRKVEFVKEYMAYLYSGNKKSELSPIAEEYLTSIGSENWMNEESWMMINSYLKKACGNSPIIDYVHENMSAYQKLYGEKEVFERVDDAFYATTFTFYTQKNDIKVVDYEAYHEYLSKLRRLNVKGVDRIKEIADMAYALISKKWDKYLNFVNQKIELMGENIDADFLSYYAGKLEQDCNVSSVRKEAAKWCELALSVTNDPKLSDKKQRLEYIYGELIKDN